MPSQSKAKNGGAGEDSCSLLDLIIDDGPNLTERDVRPLAQQLARTLSLLHAHGVVHRNLKVENIHVRVNSTGAGGGSPFSLASLSGGTRRRLRRHRHRDWQAILTDFKYAATFTAPDPDSAAVRVTTTTSSAPSPTSPLVALCGEQHSPAPELLRIGVHTPRRGAATTESAAEPLAGARAHAQLPPLALELALEPYVGSPVDVWGLGVVMFILVCQRVPFDVPTLHALREPSLRSPASLSFPKRVSKVCRDLLWRMLHADPIARASLDEVLNHPWMNPAFKRSNYNTLSVGADMPMHSHAELRWPDKVDRKTFNRIAALESRNRDDAWKGLTDALELVSSHLCEARTGRGGGVDSRGHLPELTSASNVGRLVRGLREFPDRVWPLLAKVRSCAVLEWPALIHPGPSWTFDDAPRKAADKLDSKHAQFPRPCRWMRWRYHQAKALRESAESASSTSPTKGWESDVADGPLFT